MTKYQQSIVDRLRNGDMLAANLPGQGMDNYRWRDKSGKPTSERCVNLMSVVALKDIGVIRWSDQAVKTLPNFGNPIVIRRSVVELVAE